MTRLIINADDFGYTPGVNRAILELYAARAITSTTLMANGVAADQALNELASLPLEDGARPPLGCHVVLVDGKPTAPPQTIASLLTSSPSADQPLRFQPTLPRFMADLLRGKIREQDIEREAVAQIRVLQSSGIPPTHLDTHKHTHMFPQVLRPLLRAALQCGVGAIRNPFEPDWSLQATSGAPLLRRTQVQLLRVLRPSFLKLVREAGLATTQGSIGILATGSLDEASLEKLFQAAARRPDAGSGVWELVCHPGYHDDALAAQHTRLLAAREVERLALFAMAPSLTRFQLLHYGQLRPQI